MFENKLAISGGVPVRNKTWPLMYPGGTMYGEEEVEAAVKVLRAQSPFRHYGVNLQHQVDEFEKGMCEFLENKYSLAVASGSTAITVALAALGVGPGTEVILPALMWVSDVNSVILLRAVPVLCEVNDTWNMDPWHLEKCITPRTKAIVAVHMGGSAADMDAICKVAKKYNIPVLEDCSQAAGCTIKGRQVGSFGDIATFSLQYNKNFTTGEGGMISTNNENLYRACTCFQDVGFERDTNGISKPLNSPFESFGIGCRMDEIRGAVGLAQLRKLPTICNLMRGHQQKIKSQLSDIKGIKWRKLVDPDGDSGASLGWIHEDAETAKKFKAAMNAEGIPVNTPPGGIHQYRYMTNLMSKTPFTTAGCPWSCTFNKDSNMNYSPDMLPQSNDILDRSLVLSMPPIMTEEDENDVVKAFRKVVDILL